MVRERGLTAATAGGKGGGSVLENEVNIAGLLVNKICTIHYGKLPAVTHVDFFQTAYKMMSRRCVIASAVSAKKHLSTTIRYGTFIINPNYTQKKVF